MNGLILAGGHSARMGQPKALLDYHGKPQWRQAAELLAPFCKQVFVSCRAEQEDLFAGFSTVCDKVEFDDIGPMNGVLSAFEKEKIAWFVLACDYPLLEKSDLEQLVEARNPQCVATVFSNPETGKPEPLIGIYEAAAASILLEWWKSGNQSLRVFLKQNEVQIIVPENPERLKSVDTPEAFEIVRRIWKSVAPANE